MSEREAMSIRDHRLGPVTEVSPTAELKAALEENERLRAELHDKADLAGYIGDAVVAALAAEARIDEALARIQEWRVAPVGSEPTLDVLLDGIAKALRGEKP